MMTINRFTVKQSSELLIFLSEVMPGKSRNSLKSLLSHKLVYVDGKMVTQFNHPLKPGQVVAIGEGKHNTASASHTDLKVLYEDNSIIVIDKPSGLLTIATDTEKHDTAYRRVSDYLKRSNPRAKIFILHRLDRDTSGVMIFARNQEVQNHMQKEWDHVVTDRQYQAIIEGRMNPSKGTLVHYLVEGKTGVVHVTQNVHQGQKAITHYETLQSAGLFSLVKLTLDTGRKNQIRVQLSDAGCPIAGDKKYGAKTNPAGRLALHATKLSFIHPVSKTEMTFHSALPKKMRLA